jgi:uncharacterized protein
MDPQKAGQMRLSNDTVINVAAILREQTGAARSFKFTIDRFHLDDDLDAINLTGTVRLTRVNDALLGSFAGESSVELECQRCLNEFALPVSFDFEEQFRIAFDVRRGSELEPDADNDFDERPVISENHELDFSDPMRQEIILALPMRPTCGADCPGPPTFASGEDDDVNDKFSALAALLESDDE